MERVCKHQDSQIFGLKLDIISSIFHPIKVVGRGSETQLQVGENLNCSYYIFERWISLLRLIIILYAIKYTQNLNVRFFSGTYPSINLLSQQFIKTFTQLPSGVLWHHSSG